MTNLQEQISFETADPDISDSITYPAPVSPCSSISSQSLTSSLPNASFADRESVPFSYPLEALGSAINNKYDLRPAPRIACKAPACTWIDQDATGTYDPESSFDPALQPPPEMPVASKRKRADVDDKMCPGRKIFKPLTWRYGRFEGKRLPVTFTFKSKRNRAALASFGVSLDNWPASAFIPQDLNQEWVSWWNSKNLLNENIEGQLLLDRGRSTRNRQPLIQFDEIGKQGSLAEITVGHPAARGCIPCFKLGQRCPLLDEGSRYPCDTCIEDGAECELIIEPERKASCLNCGQRRIVCSYRKSESDHSAPCLHCTSKGFKCIAGPASGRTRTGPSLDRAKPQEILGGNQPAIPTSRHKAKKRHTLGNKIKSKAGSRYQHKQNQISDTLETKRRSHSKETISRTAVDVAPPPTSSNQNTEKDAVHTIETKLAHPIEFNHEWQQMCHWCEDRGYGLLGLGKVKVKVELSADGQRYREIAGGHTAAGHPPSRMCCECTLERIMIVACTEHVIRPIEGMEPDGFKNTFVMDWMMPGQAAFAPFSWCSICPNPAFFKCCKEAQLAKGEEAFSVVDLKEGSTGCGLLLCEACAVMLVREKVGDLDALIQSLKDEDEGGFGVRADADLLMRDGDLLRQLNRG